MGFIGVGGQGSGHLFGGAWTYVAGGYAGRKEVQVLAVCDVWQDRREKATQKVNDHYAEAYGKGSWKSCEAYDDFRQVLDRSDIDSPDRDARALACHDGRHGRRRRQGHLLREAIGGDT